jgi:rare lipoprotein A (peptidoglycan hydrolase)
MPDMNKIALIATIVLGTLLCAQPGQARGWSWFVHNIKSGPHCHGKPTTYYGEGRRNADGSRFNAHGHSAASWDYPFGTVLRVTNCANGRSVDVVVKDRGPGRHQVALGIRLDLSTGAARAIALGQNGRFESGYTSHTVVSMGSGAVDPNGNRISRRQARRGGRGSTQAMLPDVAARPPYPL